MSKFRKPLHPDAPLFLTDHARPRTRRELLRQGFLGGSAMVLGAGLTSLFGARDAYARLAECGDFNTLVDQCGIATQGAGKIPFICFDLAGGANIAGSNVLVGKQGGQLDFLSTAGYSKLGLPGDMIPPILNPGSGLSDFVDGRLGLAFHSDSAFLRGMMSRMSPGTAALVDGVVLPARSDNDTGNNPLNPLYGINKAGANGELMALIGSQTSDSGGNSMAPAEMINLEVRPVKVDRPSDVTGLVDTGKLVGLLSQADAVQVMRSMQCISSRKLGRVDSKLARDAAIKEAANCAYVKSAILAERYGDPSQLDPMQDTDIVGGGGAGAIFSTAEINADGEFAKTAAVMKLVVNGFSGAGCITMGGFDYHTGDRATGEVRDFRAGECMGACLEYAARVGVPLMLYVFSDGSLSSNGMIDNSADGRGKGVWTGDNDTTAAGFFLVFNPGSRPTLVAAQTNKRQIGYFRADGSVETGSSPAANNPNLLTNTVILNYMALHGEEGSFAGLFGSGLGNINNLIAFEPIVDHVMGG